jgi:hypothetical protein
MKSFILKTTLYLLFIYFVFFYFELLIQNKITKPNVRCYVQFDWFDNANHNSQILALGNSRTWVHLNPFIIADSSMKSCEIIACDGQDPTLVFYKLKNYLKTNQFPEIMIIQFDANFYGRVHEMYGSKNWSPGYFLNRIEFGNAKTYDGYKFYYQFMPLFGIDTKTRLKILSNQTIGEDSMFEKRRGYFPNDLSFQGTWKTHNTINLGSRNPHLDSIITLGLRNKTEIVLLTPPYTNIVTSNSHHYCNQLNSQYNELCNIYNLKFNWINLYNHPINQDISNFYNHTHLNKKGSDTFSKIVATELKVIINNQKSNF